MDSRAPTTTRPQHLLSTAGLSRLSKKSGLIAAATLQAINPY